jgi:two-component system sensor histidine kinase KdpD
MADAVDAEVHRPSPDALLAAITRQQRGRLKVFLGFAPGVGKTYAMLESARRRREDGVDVVIGLVETHGRTDTEALLGDFELLPRKPLEYRGHTLQEFDLDAALARKPQLLIVDELAHSNAPGSRHAKRYRDVEELLQAGIDVYTTLNIQHLESLNDIVARITRIRVRETLPDSVLERADEIELVDVTPEELLERLEEGKVYVPDQATRAARHYFQPGNLTALRELALRRTAERVDDQMVDYMRQHAIAGPWPAGERIMVCVSAAPEAQQLVRAGRRMADIMGARWYAVYVEMPKHHRLPEAARERIATALRLAEHLGGETVVLPGRDLPGELLHFARRQNITQIILGKSRGSRLRQMIGRSLVAEVTRRSEDIAIHIITGREPPRPKEEHAARPHVQVPPLSPFLGSAGAVIGAALVGKAATHFFALPNLSLIFLMAVLYSAVSWGLAPSIFASLFSAAIYNFFFIPPLYTFTIASSYEILSFLVFLVIAILTSNLASRVRDQAETARRRMRTTLALYEFSRKLAGTFKVDDLLWALAHQVVTALRGNAMILLPEGDQLELKASYPPEDTLDAADWAAARWSWTHGEPAGRGSGTLPTAGWYFLPLKTGRATVGVVGLQRPQGQPQLEPDERRLLEAILDQAAVAIERAELDRKVAEARLLAETEKLRTALLSSISHDLRTPLASILGSASSLAESGSSFDEAGRRELLLTIQEEAERLNRFVGNLLDMTRLESGALPLNRDWIGVGEIVGMALRRVERQMRDLHVRLHVESGLPLLRVDAALVEQALFNLLDNAVKFSPAGGTIKVKARREGERVVILITDQGPGIPTDDLERIFDKFYRVRAGDRQVAGTGLGLSICRGIIEAHGGTVVAQSPASPTGGSRFVVRLPIEPQPAAPASGDA